MYTIGGKHRHAGLMKLVMVPEPNVFPLLEVGVASGVDEEKPHKIIKVLHFPVTMPKITSLTLLVKFLKCFSTFAMPRNVSSLYFQVCVYR